MNDLRIGRNNGMSHYFRGKLNNAPTFALCGAKVAQLWLPGESVTLCPHCEAALEMGPSVLCALPAASRIRP